MIKDKSYFRRKRKVASRVRGTKARPRLSVFRSNKYIYAQIVDDESKKTLVYVTDKRLSEAKLKGKSKIQRAEEVGGEIAKGAIEKKIKTVVFDRGAYRYHGRVKALADSARKGGLIF